MTGRMLTGSIAVGLAGLLFALALGFIFPNFTPDGTLAASEIATGKTLYTANCAVCHGKNLEGQADWRVSDEAGLFPAPPHDETGHTWHHTDTMLFDYTKFGGAITLAEMGIANFNSAMPGFSEQLTDAQIRAVLAYIVSTWPERIVQIRNQRNSMEPAGG